jgi:hypothetical protein
MLTETRMKWLWIDKEGSRAGAEIMMLSGPILRISKNLHRSKELFQFYSLQKNIHLVTQSFSVLH